MGMVVKTIMAFCIGAAALSAVQKYWMSAMTARVEEVSSRTDWLPPATAPLPSFDPDLMSRSLSQRPMGVIPATHP